MQFFPTVDEDVQYFRSEGYTGSINDMHYAALGDLGYSGALTDRLRAYLLDEFGSYYESMRDLRNGASVATLLAYAPLNINPALVLDFDDTYYRTGGTATDLVSATTHARAGNATMVDSDGVLKWGPHNLVTYSEEFDNVAWTKTNATVTANATTDPNGGNSADIIVPSATLAEHKVRSLPTLKATDYTVSVFAKAAGYDYFVFREDINGTFVNTFFNLSAGSIVSTGAGRTSTIEDAGDGWYKCSIEVTATASAKDIGFGVSASGTGVSFTGDGTSGIFLWGAHLYRSDLGGMVNNPARGDSYVPTTTAAVYLPRVGHHIYNGSAWVDEGYFHESEARTNLLLNSDTLSTQSATVTAVAHTLHFTGTGTITLSGTSTAGPLVGTGTGESNRVSLTFTPTAGTLTLTVSGTVTNAQLEAASTPSSYIPTSGSTVTRAADTMTIPSANLPWPEPVVIGPELVTNGTFDTDTDWAESNVDVILDTTDGTAVITNNEPGGIYQNIGTLTPGNVYKIEVNWIQKEGAGRFKLGDDIGGAEFQLTGAGDYTGENAITWVCNFPLEADGFITLGNPGGGGGTINIYDNISVSEINPLAVSIQMEGTMTYADEGNTEVIWFDWNLNSANLIQTNLRTQATATGEVYPIQIVGGVADDADGRTSQYSPGINVPFNISSRHGSTFINGAVDGVALTANTTPTALPDLSATDMDIGSTFMGTIKLFRVWADDLTDAGIEEASA